MSSPVPHSQANSVLLKPRNVIPACAFRWLGGFRAQGLTADHIFFTSYTIPSINTALAANTYTGQLGTISRHCPPLGAA